MYDPFKTLIHCFNFIFNAFSSDVTFLGSLKTPKNEKSSDPFIGHKIGTMARNELNRRMLHVHGTSQQCIKL